MKKLKQTITIYELENGFRVEVFKYQKETEFYLCHNRYGIKSLMFGLNNCDIKNEKQLISENIENEIDLYKAEYFEYIDLEVD